MILFSVWFVLAAGDVSYLNVVKWAIAVLCGASGLAVSFFALRCRIETEVRWDGVYVRFLPSYRHVRRIGPEDIVDHQAVSVRPIRDYGGWGLRHGAKGWAYLLSGNRGVMISRRDQSALFIGSTKADQLDAAVGRMLEARRESNLPSSPVRDLAGVPT
jgi:hypothetical protein